MSQLPKEGIFIRRGKKVIVCNSYGTIAYRVTDSQLLNNDKRRSLYRMFD